jgi:hypothetical protein
VEEVTFTGAVTDVSGACPVVTFNVGSVRVRTTDRTTYERGDCGKIDSRNVEVKGRGVLQDGVVEATDIEFTKGDDIVFE